jgi:hypothetical protein
MSQPNPELKCKVMVLGKEFSTGAHQEKTNVPAWQHHAFKIRQATDEQVVILVFSGTRILATYNAPMGQVFGEFGTYWLSFKDNKAKECKLLIKAKLHIGKAMGNGQSANISLFKQDHDRLTAQNTNKDNSHSFNNDDSAMNASHQGEGPTDSKISRVGQS